MEKFIGIILLSIFTEGVIAYVNNFFISKTPKWQQIISLLVGEIIAIGYGADLLLLFGLEARIPFLGVIMTGVVISRGSNYCADLIKRIINIAQGGTDIPTIEDISVDDEGLG